MASLAKSVYYYHINKNDKDDKNVDLINLIKKIYNNHKGRYGYRRITLILNNEGININHKKVLRIMKKLGLKGMMRNKRKYNSYKGGIGKIADNIIKKILKLIELI